MKKTVLRFGLLSALTAICMFLIGYFVFKSDKGYENREIFGYTTMIVSMFFVFFGIRHYRDRENAGQLSFGKGMKVGILIVLISAVLFAIFDLIYVKVIDPEFLSKYYQYELEKIEGKLSASEFQAARSKMEAEKEMFGKPLFQFGVVFMTLFVIGVIASVISSLILRRNRA